MLDISLYMLLISVAAGILVGVIAGLLPGVHVNNTSAILLGLSPGILAAGVAPFYVAVAIIASTISQSFLDIIPSIFLGAPDEDTAMAVMPGHRMLLQGRGIEAIRLSAIGSSLSICISMVLLLPLAFFFNTFYGQIQEHMALILIGISAIVLLSNGIGDMLPDRREKIKRIAWALSIFLASGFLGITAFRLDPLLSPIINISGGDMLLPLLSGLFGAPALLFSLGMKPNVPGQRDGEVMMDGREVLRGAFWGSTAGALVSWFPGVSSGVATTLTGLFSKKRDEWADRRFIVSVSGVNTSGAIFSLVALFIIMRPRSGAVAAAQELLGGEISMDMFMLFLLVICAAGVVSYIMTVAAGSRAAIICSRIDYGLMNGSVLLFLASMCFAMTGFLGTIVFLIATLIGVVPHIMEIRKTCLMGVLLVPCILYFI